MEAAPSGPFLEPPADGAVRRLRRSLLTLAGRSRLYPLSLGRGRPRDVARNVALRWPGEAPRGAALAAGEFRLAGETLRLVPPFAAPREARAEWLDEFHGFAWLADLAAEGSAQARETARQAVGSWLAEFGDFAPQAWRSDILGTRLVSWITQIDALFEPADGDTLRPAMLTSIVRQARHLGRTAGCEQHGARRLAALRGLIVGAIAQGTPERRLDGALRQLIGELPRQVLPDGGHIERSPAVQLSVLRDLVDIRTALRAAHVPTPEPLQAAIDRMAPMLRLFRHGDGRLAQFNDTAEEAGMLADLVLARAEARGRAASAAPHSGYQRLQCGKTVVVLDTGAPPPPGFDQHAHAGALSFEMSHGRERLVVNCGAYRGASAEWRRAARNTAAHSTLIVADTNSVEILADGSLGRRLSVSPADRAEDEDGQWIAVSHDGYARHFGLTHARQLFLAADGEDLRGEDSLAGRPGAGFAIRFHLHPAVQVSLAQDGAAALLRLPGGAGFRLRSQGAQMSLGESVYLGAGEIRKAQQVVLAGHVGTQGATVRWAIRREGKKAAEA